ncbi:hypothetical protein THAOC_08204 [Thalassiosira oceanica]|uniref:5'-deoxynucleotidase n=1 Tax=Thalassiosira oceanica TaxID=159749 RepID=K0SZL8_THAOC|nr:hypothetical protein THAOC_08204 [Thalassiosira oceanica]|eukprot:EJK70439.1 hypothetical protein THAOC_08204 [Thalassiosira oceanica]
MARGGGGGWGTADADTDSDTGEVKQQVIKSLTTLTKGVTEECHCSHCTCFMRSVFLVVLACWSTFFPIDGLRPDLGRRRSTMDNPESIRLWEKATSTDVTSESSAATDESAKRAVDFLTLTRSLKTTKRTGWVMCGVQNPESIADHMYRMSLMAMIASFSNGRLDCSRCIKLALIHDLAEAKVGDITPHCGVSDEDKHRMELNTMESISRMLGQSMGGDEMLELWKEYEEGTTEEARLLKDLDKIEMILQAQEYEAEKSSEKSLDQFFTSTEGKWRTEIGKAWAKEIVSRRKVDNPSK